MKKEQVLELTARVSAITGEPSPVIVGSQSLYAVTGDVPESVRRSVECDFLLLGVERTTFTAVMEQLGVASNFQAQTGYHADPLGLATVVLAAGWRERLVPLADDAGTVRAYCLEIHDTCVSKLMAGREKDFIFIRNVLERGLADLKILIARAELVQDMPQSDALLPRLVKLESYLKVTRGSLDLIPLRQLIVRLSGLS